MLDLIRIVPQITATLDRILDRVPVEEMRAKYDTPDGLRIKIEIEGAEIFTVIRKKPEAKE